MTAASALATGDNRSIVTFRGTKCGLEVHIERFGSTDSVAMEMRKHFGKSPSFFRGEDVILRFAGVPVLESFGPLEQVMRDFGMRVVAVRSNLEQSRKNGVVEAVVEEAGIESDMSEKVVEGVTRIASEAAVAAAKALALGSGPIPTEDRVPKPETPMVRGPIRSGCIHETTGSVTIIGDVNPGAEVRAGGSIVVLGSLRGVAHAALSEDGGFIWALHLSPQQLRIGSLVARPDDSDAPSDSSEIAYAKNGRIIVEAYKGRPLRG